jgi:ribosome biogenesis GTPase / thiamine phosphate phosphatase
MSALQTGLVVSHLGKGIAVEVGEEIVLCQTLRKLDAVVVGDQVEIARVNVDQGRIERILPRRSVLERPDRGGASRAVAANIDTVFVVFASEPLCDWLLVDQYLAVCEHNGLTVALLQNKIDLPGADELLAELDFYRRLDYPLYRVSSFSGQGMAELQHCLSQQTSLLAGQSGVGKSSLSSHLLPDKTLKINSVSAVTKHGRHTTTAATLYHLPFGGRLIDSPGVAIFGLAGLSEAQLAWGFREFQNFVHQCRFNDCRHLNDKGCAVKSAVQQGLIREQRYQRFLKLREKMPPGNLRSY